MFVDVCTKGRNGFCCWPCSFFSRCCCLRNTLSSFAFAGELHSPGVDGALVLGLLLTLRSAHASGLCGAVNRRMATPCPYPLVLPPCPRKRICSSPRGSALPN
eukprot:3356042-Pyramimonas_sp.AAC.1